MLVVTRRIGESLVIGDDIIVTCLNVVGRQVKIGISAPLDVKILRSELIQKEEDYCLNEELNNQDQYEGC